MNALIAVLIALGLSLAGNAFLWNSRDNAIEKAAEHKSAFERAAQAAKECSDGVTAIQEKAAERVKAAMTAIAAAQKRADKSEAKAQTILGTQPAVPSDACKSAELLNQSQIAARRAAKGLK